MGRVSGFYQMNSDELAGWVVVTGVMVKRVLRCLHVCHTLSLSILSHSLSFFLSLPQLKVILIDIDFNLIAGIL